MSRRTDEAAADVIPHNTMRFDVQLCYVHPMIKSGEVSVEVIAADIRKAISEIIERRVGEGLDGVPIPGGVISGVIQPSDMLHREHIYCDLS